MANILYLVHRLPYPPNKGDKVRSFNLLKYLSASHNVFLGTFVDDPEDEKYVDLLDEWCVDVFAEKINKTKAKISALTGLLTNDALTNRYYASKNMKAWTEGVFRDQKIDVTVVFSATMAQFVPDSRVSSMLVDFVDVDSMKWKQYSDARKWPFSWLFSRESTKLLEFEKKLSEQAKHSFFVTESEVELFKNLTNLSGERITALMNGVDDVYFSSKENRSSPYVQVNDDSKKTIPIVFTGAMDYWPNVDAVCWFCNEILPSLLNLNGNLVFYIVGRSPTREVMALSSSCVVVTGTVDDVRPYIQHAALAVAPLRVARGIQNKILESMAMGLPVVATKSCVDVIGAIDDQEIASATSAQEFIDRITDLLSSPVKRFDIGMAAREKVRADFSWASQLEKLSKYIDPLGNDVPGDSIVAS